MSASAAEGSIEVEVDALEVFNHGDKRERRTGLITWGGAMAF